MEFMEPIMILGLVLGVYFLPALVAYSRKLDNKVQVLVLTIFLGWTFVGWVIALVMASKAKKDNF